MTTLSLYELIKQKSKEKGRKLKIICDWDECLQPFNPKVWYKLIKEKGWEQEGERNNFKDYFSFFWENASMEYFPYQRTTNTCNKTIEKLRKDKDIFQKEVREPFFKISGSPDFYKNCPFLSIAEELLKCLKENLISELWIISTTSTTEGVDGRKETLFKKTFAKFPQCFLMLKPKGGLTGPTRRKWIKNNHPNFDIFIDDHADIADAQKLFTINGSDKYFVTPDYKVTRSIQAPNLYHVKTTVSDLKDQDFVIAALEMKTKKLEQELTSAKQAREKTKTLYWTMGIIGTFMVIVLLIFAVIKKKNKQHL